MQYSCICKIKEIEKQIRYTDMMDKIIYLLNDADKGIGYIR